MTTRDHLDRAARQAAADWGFEAQAIELLSLSENAVYRLDTAGGERLVLRLHRPGYNSLPEMRSELLWVDSLRAAGLATPVARRTAAGDGYTTVAVGEADGAEPGETRVVGVLEWVEGTLLDEELASDPSRAGGHYHRLGALAARIHHHAEEWQPPEGFVRRRWDADGLVGLDPLWGRFWEVAALTADQRELFAAARSRLHERLTQLPVDRSAFGLIHADLHLRNVMVDGDRLVVIDFDDAGWGWYVHELAVALDSAVGEPWFDDARDALVDGYRSVRPLSDEALAVLPAFLLQRVLTAVAWVDARPELGLADRLPRIAADAERRAIDYLRET